MDATMKRFTLEITNIRQMYTTVVLAMGAAGKFTRTPVRGAKGVGLPEFQAAVSSGRYAHVALLNVGDIVQEWHQEGEQAAEAKPERFTMQSELDRVSAERQAWINRLSWSQQDRHIQEMAETFTRPDYDWL